MAEIEAALPLVTPAVTEWGLVQDLVTGTSAKMGSLETLIKMTGKLDIMDNDMDSVTSLELTHTIPSTEVRILLLLVVTFNNVFLKVINKSRIINKRVTLNVGGVR